MSRQAVLAGEHSGAHQALRREVNEQIRKLHDTFLHTGQLDAFCECGARKCASRFAIDVADYERVRRSVTRFLVAAGHGVLDSIRIVSEHGEFVVVEKSRRPATHSVRGEPLENRLDL